MACTSPLQGYRTSIINPKTGKFGVTLNVKEGHYDLPSIPIPCRQCIWCRLNTSREDAVRVMHEASLWEENTFITLTYAPEHLPPDGSIDPPAVQKFMKRLRDYICRKEGCRIEGLYDIVTRKKIKCRKLCRKIRSFGCAEYGEKKGRPHYHIILFNYDFSDKELLKVEKGFNYYKSDSLSKLWRFGHNVITDLTFESAAYVARYVTKKLTGLKEELYLTLGDYGEILSEKLPERSVARSRRPGIGRGFLEKYFSDVYPGDSVVIKRKGRYIEVKPPRYYDRILEQQNPELFKEIKLRRLKLGEDRDVDEDRLRVLQELYEIRFNLLKRSYEIDS